MSNKILALMGLASLSVLSACVNLPPQYDKSMTPVQLKAGAENVKIVEFLPTESREKYNEVDMVSCAIGGNMKGVQTNINSCENKLKNAAADKGSSLVFVKPETKKIGATAFNTGMQTANCENCVEMTGIILIEKTVKK